MLESEGLGSLGQGEGLEEERRQDVSATGEAEESVLGLVWEETEQEFTLPSEAADFVFHVQEFGLLRQQ